MMRRVRKMIRIRMIRLNDCSILLNNWIEFDKIEQLDSKFNSIEQLAR